MAASRPACRCRWAATPSAATSAPRPSRSVTSALRDSIQYALDHRDEALAYAMQFARDMDTALADRFVGMYVNDRTLDYGEDGREAIRKLLDMGHDRGIIPAPRQSRFCRLTLHVFSPNSQLAASLLRCKLCYL